MKGKVKLLGFIMIILALNITILSGFVVKDTKNTKKVAPKKKVTASKTAPSVKKPEASSKVKKPAAPAKVQKSAAVPEAQKPAAPKEAVIPQAQQDNTKASASKGLLWMVKSDSATVYMLGSVHVSKPEMFPFNKTVEDAFNNSNNLAVEVNINDKESILKSQSKLIYDQNDNIYNHLSAAGKEKLDSLAKEYGLNSDAIKTLKIWVLSSALLSMQTNALGYSDGVDAYFLNKAAGKKILELEGMDFQVDLLNSFTDEEQEKSFILDVTPLKDTEVELNKLFDAYKACDEKTLTEMLVDESKKVSENYYNKMYLERNAGMADKIDGYLKTNDTYFVVAGAAHFLGDGSVIEQLKKKGYEVTRVDN